MALPALTWHASPNYSSRGGQAVRLIVVHDCEGSYEGSIGWFSQTASQVSAHLVLSEDGSKATQMVAWANKAWHACNFNPFSEGIEAAGYAAKGLLAVEWGALAALVAWRLLANGLPLQIATASNNWTGFCQHVDLGAAGGGHHDITLDGATRAAFLQRVQASYAEGLPKDAPGVKPNYLPLPLPSAPPGWAPSGTTRHDLGEGTLAWVQSTLNKLYPRQVPLVVDGLDGGFTRNALRTFQSDHHLAITGAVDALTVSTLKLARGA